jgi:hypothetical protein
VCHLTFRPLIALLVVESLTLHLLANQPIGVAVSTGRFQINSEAAVKNATILDGMSFETLNGRAHLHIKDKGRIVLWPSGSRARAYESRFVLESGICEVEFSSATKYSVEAGDLVVRPAAAGAKIIVGTDAKGHVAVGVLSGFATVSHRTGKKTVNLKAGVILAFSSDPNYVGSARDWIVSYGNHRYYVENAATKQRIEINPTTRDLGNLNAGSIELISGAIDVGNGTASLLELQMTNSGWFSLSTAPASAKLANNPIGVRGNSVFVVDDLVEALLLAIIAALVIEIVKDVFFPPRHARLPLVPLT